MTSKKVLISLPDRMLQELNDRARADIRSRSEYIREALRSYFALTPPPPKQLKLEELDL